MKINKVKCDHCGKELDEHEINCDIDIKVGFRIKKSIDLCKKCTAELWRKIEAFCNTAKEGEKA